MNDNHIADERKNAIDHAQKILRAVKLYDLADALAAPIAPRADADTAGAKRSQDWIDGYAEGKIVARQLAAAGASNERADADPDAVLRAYRQGVEDATAFPYQKTFDAIAAATSISCGTIAISVIKFREVFGLLDKSAERADAEKDVALTDVQILSILDSMPDRAGAVQFARAILAAKEKK